ncbi:MAG: fibrobacter succinogenes major paralogous domain-containing protein [Bacteroidales bacterium]|nr:fibrobacter succinogenes major paralogous domain-containing protein [Bacteroidales bacterium]
MNFTLKITRITIVLIIFALLFSSCKKATLPGVTTGSVSRIMQTSAYSGGQVTNDGGAHISGRGVCWSTSFDPTLSDNKTADSTGTGLFTSHITGLTPNTLYYVRAYATNSEGTSYGEMVSFTTDQVAEPTVVTSGLKSVTLTTAASGGDVTNDGRLPITTRGVCWNTTGSPTIADSHSSDGTGTGLFSSALTELTIGTTYHVRAYATNSLGTGYGSDVEFIQMEPILDYDGNAYSVVTIGTQTWMGENLKTTKFNDGTSIPNITGGTEWANMDTPAFCWYNNSEPSYKSLYGGIYNWHAVNTGKLCPTGWHVPLAEDYTILIGYLGGESLAGGKLKEAGTAHWATPNLGATNGSGFTALPGGGRYNIYSAGGSFTDLGNFGYWWSATASATTAKPFSYDMGFNIKEIKKVNMA